MKNRTALHGVVLLWFLGVSVMAEEPKAVEAPQLVERALPTVSEALKNVLNVDIVDGRSHTGFWWGNSWAELDVAGQDGFMLVMNDPDGTVTEITAWITEVTDEVILWEGFLNEEPADGSIAARGSGGFVLDTHTDGWRYEWAFASSNSIDQSGGASRGVTVTIPCERVRARCVCWQGGPGSSCSDQECDDADSCGTNDDKTCTWRARPAGTGGADNCIVIIVNQ